MSDKKALQKALAKEEALLSKLDAAREKTLAKLNELHRELTALESTCSEPHSLFTTRTSQENVTLFRMLFHGREDIFPKLWTSRAQASSHVQETLEGISGYRLCDGLSATLAFVVFFCKEVYNVSESKCRKQMTILYI